MFIKQLEYFPISKTAVTYIPNSYHSVFLLIYFLLALIFFTIIFTVLIFTKIIVQLFMFLEIAHAFHISFELRRY